MPARLFVLALVICGSGACSSAPVSRINIPTPLAELERLVEESPNDPIANYNLAMKHWSEGRWEESEQALRETIAIEGKFALAYLALAYLPFARDPILWDDIFDNRLSEQGRTEIDEASRLYRRAFMIDPFVDQGVIGATTPRQAVTGEGYSIFAYVIEQWANSFDDFLDGRHDRSYEGLDRLIRELGRTSAPDEIPDFLYWYRGLSAAQIGLWDEAIADMTVLLDRSLEQEAKDSLIFAPLRTNEYRYVLAVVNHRADRLVEAIRLYQQVLQNDLGLYMAHVQLASIYEMSGRWPQAIAERRRAVQANPEDSSLLLELGATLAMSGNFAEAEPVFEEAIEQNPREVLAYYFLGLVQTGLKKTDDARAAFQAFLDGAPSGMQRQIGDARERLADLSS